MNTNKNSLAFTPAFVSVHDRQLRSSSPMWTTITRKHSNLLLFKRLSSLKMPCTHCSVVWSIGCYGQFLQQKMCLLLEQSEGAVNAAGRCASLRATMARRKGRKMSRALRRERTKEKNVEIDHGWFSDIDFVKEKFQSDGRPFSLLKPSPAKALKNQQISASTWQSTRHGYDRTTQHIVSNPSSIADGWWTAGDRSASEFSLAKPNIR